MSIITIENYREILNIPPYEHMTEEILYDCCSRESLSEEFIDKFSNKLTYSCWYMISVYQKLSELFIRKYSRTLVWRYISRYQRFSEKFIDENIDKIYFSELLINKNIKLSEKFIEKYITEFEKAYVKSLIVINYLGIPYYENIILKLREGQFKCECCLNNNDFNSRKYCQICKGLGKLNWIEKIKNI